jgi:hypothetical protein
MTSPVTPIMWVIILAIGLTVLAVPFAHVDGLPGRIATVAVIVAAVLMWASLLLGFVRRLRD